MADVSDKNFHKVKQQRNIFEESSLVRKVQQTASRNAGSSLFSFSLLFPQWCQRPIGTTLPIWQHAPIRNVNEPVNIKRSRPKSQTRKWWGNKTTRLFNECM